MKKLFLSIMFSATISTGIAQNIDYPTQVQTIFNAKCTGCHGSNGGLSLTSYSNLMAGTSNNGPVVVPGNANGSVLYNKVRLDQAPPFGARMPQGGSLSQSEVNLIRDWINQGATATNNEELATTGRFMLQGNFPNPFNPGTTVAFTSPAAGKLTLSVFNVLGQHVMEQSINAAAGSNSIYLSLNNQPTGLFVYRLTGSLANGELINQTRTMLLAK